MNKRIVLFLKLCLLAMVAVAQDNTSLVNGKEKKDMPASVSRPLQVFTLFGGGFCNQLDMYLSPMEYTG
jgi:hypothetical protein